MGILALASGAALLETPTCGYNLLTSIVAGVITAAILASVKFAAVHRRWLRVVVSLVPYLWTPIRLSVSYLYRIEVDGKFLLVRSSRIHGQFQPVGGVYKATASGVGYLDRLGAVADDNLPVDQTSQSDLRIRVVGRRVPKFLAWFVRGAGREVGVWREFYEELVQPEILPASVFPFVLVQRRRLHLDGIRYSQHFRCRELLVAEIFEPQLTEAQLAALRHLQKDGEADVLWASQEDIRRLGARRGENSHFTIGRNAQWLLP